MKRDEFVEGLISSHMEDMRELIQERVRQLIDDGVIRGDEAAAQAIVNLQMESYLRGVQDTCEHFREVFRSSRREAELKTQNELRSGFTPLPERIKALP